ncbi:hypothetical protein U1Q18_050934 [Sarracenia purpurea var. burkii]
MPAALRPEYADNWKESQEYNTPSPYRTLHTLDRILGVLLRQLRTQKEYTVPILRLSFQNCQSFSSSIGNYRKRIPFERSDGEINLTIFVPEVEEY